MKRIIIPALFCGLLLSVGCVKKNDQLAKGSNEPEIGPFDTVHVEFPQYMLDTYPTTASDHYLKSGLPKLKAPERIKRVQFQRAGALKKEVDYFSSPLLIHLGPSCDSLNRRSPANPRFDRKFTLTDKKLKELSARDKIGFTLGYPEQEIQNCEHPGYDVGEIEAISPHNHSIGYGIKPSWRQYEALRADYIAVQKELFSYLEHADSISDAMVDLNVNAELYALYPAVIRIYQSQTETDDLILTALLGSLGYDCEESYYPCMDEALKKRLTWDKHGKIRNTPQNVDRIIQYILEESPKRMDGKDS